jgi:hypothetical protein
MSHQSPPQDLEELELRDLQEVRSNLLSLKEHPGFQWLTTFLKNQITVRRQTLEQPITEMLAFLSQECVKGEIIGMTQAVCYVDSQLGLLQSLIDDKTEELDHERVIQKINGNTAE